MAPARTLNNVDLPAPLGPIRPEMVPRAMVNETPSTARRPPKSLVTFRSASIAQNLPWLSPQFWYNIFDQRSNQAIQRRNVISLLSEDLGVVPILRETVQTRIQ